MKRVTKRQQEIYDFMKEYISSHKYPPSIREIGNSFGIRSTNGVRDSLKALEKKGLIKKISNKARSIEILKKVEKSSPHHYTHILAMHQDTHVLPIIGRIAAGKPILAEENVEDAIAIDKSILPRSHQVFALRVYGDSMSGDGILDGDIAIIRVQKNAEHGQIIAAVIDGSATLKHYHRQQNRIELRASNENYLPITVTEGEDFSIAGILAGVIRKY
jgi:repressor LexA